MNRLYWSLIAVAVLVNSDGAHADVFGSGANSFQIDFVTIGSAGNAPDTTGDPNLAGAVLYEYRIGRYEISEQMIEKANALGGLEIMTDLRGPDKPATSVSWFDAARFVNWLNSSTGSVPAYKFEGGGFQLWTPADVGYNESNRFRNSLARYALPNVDEWYKAAFYDPVGNSYFDFPTGSDAVPIPVANGTAPGTAVFNQTEGPADIMLAGGPSPFGTVGQAGNVWEWDETDSDLVNDDSVAVRGLRGYAWFPTVVPLDLSSSFRNSALPWRSVGNVGFRVVDVVPEPNSVWLAMFAAWILSIRK